MVARRLTVKEITSTIGISVGFVHTILHEDLKIQKISSRWVSQILTYEHKSSSIAMCHAICTRDDMNSACISSIVTTKQTWIPFLNPQTIRQDSVSQS